MQNYWTKLGWDNFNFFWNLCNINGILSIIKIYYTWQTESFNIFSFTVWLFNHYWLHRLQLTGMSGDGQVIIIKESYLYLKIFLSYNCNMVLVPVAFKQINISGCSSLIIIKLYSIFSYGRNSINTALCLSVFLLFVSVCSI
jgi:hypothetical protein